MRIDHEAIDSPPHAPLEPDGPSGRVVCGRKRRLRVVGTVDRWLEIEGRRRRAVRLLEHAGEEAERMANQNGPGLVEPLDAGIAFPQPGGRRAEDDLQPAPRMPEIGILRDAIELLVRGVCMEGETGAANHLAERLGRRHDDLVTSRLELTADADERVDVAGGTDRSHNEVHK